MLLYPFFYWWWPIQGNYVKLAFFITVDTSNTRLSFICLRILFFCCFVSINSYLCEWGPASICSQSMITSMPTFFPWVICHLSSATFHHLFFFFLNYNVEHFWLSHLLFLHLRNCCTSNSVHLEVLCFLLFLFGVCLILKM